jgi:predicted nucleic acid-binding protein
VVAAAWLEYPIDFTDAYYVACMRSAGISEIYAWDRGYSHVKDINRIEPNETIKDAA